MTDKEEKEYSLLKEALKKEQEFRIDNQHRVCPSCKRICEKELEKDCHCQNCEDGLAEHGY